MERTTGGYCEYYQNWARLLDVIAESSVIVIKARVAKGTLGGKSLRPLWFVRKRGVGGVRLIGFSLLMLGFGGNTAMARAR